MAKTATAARPMARVSIKDAGTIFKNVRKRPVVKVKAFLNDLMKKKRNIEGKHYTGATKQIIKLIEEAEANAESLGLDTEKLFLKEAVANKSFTYVLPKSRWSHRGKRAKLCQLKVTVEER